jgi:hypothetical protein
MFSGMPGFAQVVDEERRPADGTASGPCRRTAPSMSRRGDRTRRPRRSRVAGPECRPRRDDDSVRARATLCVPSWRRDRATTGSAIAVARCPRASTAPAGTHSRGHTVRSIRADRAVACGSTRPLLWPGEAWRAVASHAGVNRFCEAGDAAVDEPPLTDERADRGEDPRWPAGDDRRLLVWLGELVAPALPDWNWMCRMRWPRWPARRGPTSAPCPHRVLVIPDGPGRDVSLLPLARLRRDCLRVRAEQQEVVPERVRASEPV